MIEGNLHTKDYQFRDQAGKALKMANDNGFIRPQATRASFFHKQIHEALKDEIPDDSWALDVKAVFKPEDIIEEFVQLLSLNLFAKKV